MFADKIYDSNAIHSRDEGQDAVPHIPFQADHRWKKPLLKDALSVCAVVAFPPTIEQILHHLCLRYYALGLSLFGALRPSSSLPTDVQQERGAGPFGAYAVGA